MTFTIAFRAGPSAWRSPARARSSPTAHVARRTAAPAAATAPVVDDIPFASPDAARRDGAERARRLGRRAHRQRGDAVRPRRRYRIDATLDPVKHTIDRQAAADLAQPQRPPGVRGVPAPVPQCVRGPGQHLHDRAAQQRLRLPQRRRRRGRRLGLHRSCDASQQDGATVRVALRAARRRPEDRPHRGAPRPAASRSRRAAAPRSTSTSSTSCRA